MLNKANEPCRRRAIYALKEKDYGKKDETVKNAPDAMQEVSPYMCPKCNRIYKRGMYFHQKYCRGL